MQQEVKILKSLQIIYNTITTISINFTCMSTTATAASAMATAKTTAVMIIIIIIIMVITMMMTKIIQVTPVSCTPYKYTSQCGVKR